jgi:TonB family protein
VEVPASPGQGPDRGGRVADRRHRNPCAVPATQLLTGDTWRIWEREHDRRRCLSGIIGGLPGQPPPPIDPDLVAAQLVRRVEPVYPTAAKSSGLKGTVRFRATLGEDGAITSLQLVSGHPMLVSAARTAVSQWLYNPWTAVAKQVEISTTIDVDVK